MLEAAFWGLLGASSLIVGALRAFYVRMTSRDVGLISAFGAGVLMSAVKFELRRSEQGSTTVDFGRPNVRWRSDHRDAGPIDGA